MIDLIKDLYKLTLLRMSSFLIGIYPLCFLNRVPTPYLNRYYDNTSSTCSNHHVLLIDNPVKDFNIYFIMYIPFKYFLSNPHILKSSIDRIDVKTVICTRKHAVTSVPYVHNRGYTPRKISRIIIVNTRPSPIIVSL